MMAAVLVLAGSLIVATERADAQSTTILVSNQGTNPDSHGFLFGPDPTYNTNYELAGAFTTGPNDYGYGLASVTLVLSLSAFETGTPVPEVTIHSDRNGAPGQALVTLDPPPNIGGITTASQYYTFNTPPQTKLAPETTYWVSVHATGIAMLFRTSRSPDEDGGKEDGWSIGNNVMSRTRDSGSAWAVLTSRTGPKYFRMGLRGVVFTPDVGQLALYWLDQSGQQDHPEANGNLLQLQYCRGTLPFMVYFHGNMDHRDIDEWDVDIRPRRGVVGDVTYGFREQTDANDGFHQMFGRVTFDGPTSMTIKIRARDGNTWGPWSPPSGLYCREVPRVASITTSGGQIINEGDSFTFDVVFDKPMQLDTDLTLRLTRSEGSYPKFTGGLGEKTITVRRGQSNVSLDMRSIDDNIRSMDPEITLEIVPGTRYRAGHRNAVSFQIRDGSYEPELDANGNPTGDIVFNRDTVTRSFPRCGEGSDSTATNRVGLVEVREDAGTIQVPVHTIAGGTDFVHNYVIVNMQGTATREDDYNAPAVVTFQPLAETTLIDVEILNDLQLEDTQSFRLTLVLNAFTAAQHLLDCQEAEIIIEDDDTADTTIRIADGADAAFTDFVGREARVTEGNTIKLQVSTPAETGQCIVPFPINAWTTASGDVSVIDQSGFTTNNGTQSGLRIPPCTRADEMHVPTVQTAGDQGTKTVYFDIAPVADERIFLEGGRETVRYTVHIDDSEAGSQQVEADTTVDETPPQLQSATVDGSSLTLSYDEELDNGSLLSSGLFAVNVNQASRPVMGVAVGQSNVILFLSPAVVAGDAVTVDYTVPTDEEAGRVRDTSGNAAESFSGQAVTNDTTSSGGGGGGERSDEQAPPGVPQGLDVALQQSGKLKATWKAPGSGPAPTGYTVQWKAAVDAWEDPGVVSETDVTKTSYVIGGLTDGVEYAARVVATRDGADSAPSEEVTAMPRETTPPELSSASVDGAELTLTFNEALNTDMIPHTSAFAVTLAGGSRGVDAVAASGSAVTLTLETAVFAGDAVTVDYTAPAGDSASKLKDQVGNAAASFSGRSVTNHTPAAVQLTASTHDVPAAHDGRTTFTFELRFSETPRKGFSYKTMRDHAFTVTGGDVVKARRLEKGKNVRWEISIRPDGNGTVTIVLPMTTDCEADGAVCTDDGRKLSQGFELTVPGISGPEITSGSSFSVDEGATEVATLRATDGDTPAANLTWSISGGDDAAKFAVTAAGALSFAAAKDYETPDDAGADGVYEVTVQVSDGGRTDSADLTVTLTNVNEAPTADAGSDQADVEQGAAVTLSGFGTDPDSGDTLSYAWTQSGTPAVTLSDSAVASPTFTAPTGLSADTALTFTLRVTDDEGMYAEDSVTVTIEGQETPSPLTASVSGMPASHDGSASFTFELRFSENPRKGFSYKTVRDHAFTVTSGDVTKARRLEKGKNVRWEISVTPDVNGTVTIVLPATTDCTAEGAICTQDGRMLSNRLEITVPGPGG